MANYKNIFKTAALGMALAAASQAQASTINVGGVMWDPESGIDFKSNGDVIETNVNALGDVLAGFGRISNINGNAAFCPGCELTFEFSYTLTGVSGAGAFLGFDVNYINFYVDATPDYSDDISANAKDGNLWLKLDGHATTSVISGLTADLHSIVTAGSLGGLDEEGSGSGYLDAIGGMALEHFDTNTKITNSGLADLAFTSSFHNLTSPTAEGFPKFGSIDVSGNTIPEPASIALLGVGLVGLGASSLRRRNKKSAVAA